jgi:hypothetical protein
MACFGSFILMISFRKHTLYDGILNGLIAIIDLNIFICKMLTCFWLKVLKKVLIVNQ